MSAPTRKQENVTCPRCGHVELNSSELFTGFAGDGAQTVHACEKCDAKLIVTMDVSVTYDAEATL